MNRFGRGEADEWILNHKINQAFDRAIERSKVAKGLFKLNARSKIDYYDLSRCPDCPGVTTTELVGIDSLISANRDLKLLENLGYYKWEGEE